MKKINIFGLFTMLLVMLVTAGCSKDDIVFDHEKQQFEAREGVYLLEVIMPQGTPTDKDIYIVGAINGGDLENIIGNDTWKLQKAENSDIKWGIYLDPATFQEGTSLEDGYTFWNAKEGMERSLENTEVIHTECPALGSWCNVVVNRWESYFSGGGDNKPVHKQPTVYVKNETTWNNVYLYMWGDVNDLGGAWPGIAPTGTEIQDGEVWTYWDLGEEAKGLNENLIFNNNDGSQLADYNYTFEGDLYLLINDEGVTFIKGGAEEPDEVVDHDGYAVFVYNATGWDAIYAYAWGTDLPELYGGWPGVEPTGTQRLSGNVWTYWDAGAANNGLLYNFIFNNNAGSQIENNDILGVTLDKNYFFWLKNVDGTLSVEALDGPEGFDPGEEPVVPPGPEPTPDPEAFKIYVNADLPYAEYALYAWGTDIPESFGLWPGKTPTETVTIAGADYMVFDYECVRGSEINLILNDNGAGQQLDNPTPIIVDKDYYFMVNADGWNELPAPEPEPATPFKVYVTNNTGFDNIYLYSWEDGGNPQVMGAWPGVLGVDEDADGKLEWTVTPADGVTVYNLIFNNNEGVQSADFKVDGTAAEYNVVLTYDESGEKPVFIATAE